MTVLDGPPRDPQAGRLVIIGDITGQVTPAAMTSGRRRFDDRFSVDVLVVGWDPGGSNPATTRAAVEDVADVILQTLAERVHLEDTPGGAALDGIVAAVVAKIAGPTCWWDGDGIGAAMTVTVDVHARIH